MSRIRVLIADDHTVIRDGLAAYLNHHSDLEVIAQVGDGRAAVEETGRLRPDVVVMDVRMPHLNGIEATQRITALFGSKVVGLSMEEADTMAGKMLGAGAVAYVPKTAAPEELVVAVRTAARPADQPPANMPAGSGLRLSLPKGQQIGPAPLRAAPISPHGHHLRAAEKTPAENEVLRPGAKPSATDAPPA